MGLGKTSHGSVGSRFLMGKLCELGYPVSRFTVCKVMSEPGWCRLNLGTNTTRQAKREWIFQACFNYNFLLWNRVKSGRPTSPADWLEAVALGMV